MAGASVAEPTDPGTQPASVRTLGLSETPSPHLQHNVIDHHQRSLSASGPAGIHPTTGGAPRVRPTRRSA